MSLTDRLLSLRHRLYDNNLLPSCRSRLPVISVGSLTIGGAGKTPLTLYLIRELLKAGRQPALLTRGYRRKGRGVAVLPVSGSTGPHRSIAELAAEYGDEPLLFRQQFPDLPIFVSARRCLALPLIEADRSLDCILLDDGFQHRAIQRDLDILIFRREFRGAEERYFPAGSLRDSLIRLKAADLILAENGSSESVLNYLSGHAPVLIYKRELSIPDPGELRPPLTAFAGVADPLSFFSSLKTAGMELEREFSFRDHIQYSRPILDKLKAAAAGGSLICTEKDYVKLPAAWLDSVHCLPVPMRLELQDSREPLMSRIISVLP